jgi:hypothetical protein
MAAPFRADDGADDRADGCPPPTFAALPFDGDSPSDNRFGADRDACRQRTSVWKRTPRRLAP